MGQRDLILDNYFEYNSVVKLKTGVEETIRLSMIGFPRSVFLSLLLLPKEQVVLAVCAVVQ